MHDVLGLILGGGRGARLYPLTRRRSEPAVPIAGKYRLIDIPISNCLNNNLRRVYVLTQYLSASLHRHIANTYHVGPFSAGFVEVLAAQQTNETADWYQGTADAVRQNLRYIQDEDCRDVLLLSGDQLYRMNFAKLLQAHRDRKADVTLAVVPVTREQAAGYGVVRLDDDQRVTAFVEKPQAEQLDALRTPSAWLQQRGLAQPRGEYLANMGIYLFNRAALFSLLEDYGRAKDLVLDVLQPTHSRGGIRAFLFDGYWEDVGTIKSYFQASLALASDQPPFDFHSPEGLIYTRSRNLPASRVHNARLEQCLVSDGCTVRPGAHLQRCVLGVRSQVGRDVTLRDVVMLGANYFEGERHEGYQSSADAPVLGIGDHSVLERVIVDKNCRIGRNVRIVNERAVQEAEGDNYVIRDGIVVIPNRAVVPDGTVI